MDDPLGCVRLSSAKTGRIFGFGKALVPPFSKSADSAEPRQLSQQCR